MEPTEERHWGIRLLANRLVIGFACILVILCAVSYYVVVHALPRLRLDRELAKVADRIEFARASPRARYDYSLHDLGLVVEELDDVTRLFLQQRDIGKSVCLDQQDASPERQLAAVLILRKMLFANGEHLTVMDFMSFASSPSSLAIPEAASMAE